MEDKITMSKKELSRIVVCQKVIAKELSIIDASKLIGISYRQTKRIIKKYRIKGAKGLIHENRGRPSSKKISKSIEQQIVALYDKKYNDFKPTFFNEKLAELHKIIISPETARKILIKNDRWKTKKVKGQKK